MAQPNRTKHPCGTILIPQISCRIMGFWSSLAQGLGRPAQKNMAHWNGENGDTNPWRLWVVFLSPKHSHTNLSRLPQSTPQNIPPKIPPHPHEISNRWARPHDRGWRGKVMSSCLFPHCMNSNTQCWLFIGQPRRKINWNFCLSNPNSVQIVLNLS